MNSNNTKQDITGDPNRIAYLIYRFMEKKLSKAERKELDEWVKQSERNYWFFEKITDKEVFKQYLFKYLEI